VPLLLSEGDVARCLTLRDVVPLMRETLRRFSRRECVQPVRTSVEIGPTGVFGSMPASVPAIGQTPAAFGLKAVSFFPENDQRGLPTHLAQILLYDATTGALDAILDGRLITEMRTAAATAVATDVLARPGPVRLALLGSGVQARSHLQALALVRPLSDVRVWSRRPEHAARFADAMDGTVDAGIAPAGTVAEAVAGADVIVTVTSAVEPILPGTLLAPGMHLNVVGSSSAAMREVDGHAVARCRVWVDSQEAWPVEAGDLVLAVKEGRIGPEHVVGEIGDVVDGRSGRRDADEITMFKSLGMAVEDVASAALALRRARAQELGAAVPL
jgi:ornithine cyclodeaminase